MALLRPLAVLLALPAAPGAGIEGLFAELDVNANGYVSKLELRRGAAAVRELAGELAADEVFGAADTDGNRMLSAEELGRFAASSAVSAQAASSQAEPRRQPPSEPQALQRERPSFELHASCEPCVAAGFGWSVRLGKCGGFANKRCGGAPSSGDGLAEENRALQSELATALAFVDELLLDGEASGDGTGGDAAAKVARARQLLRERGAEGERCAAEPTVTPERSRGWEEWRPSKGEVASFMPKISSFAWTPLWSAPTSNLDLAALRAHILKDRERNPGLQKSNDGGFHSEGDLLAPAAAAKTPVLKAFRNEIYRHVHAHLRSLAVATAAVGGPGETREDNRPYRIILGTAWYNFNRAGPSPSPWPLPLSSLLRLLEALRGRGSGLMAPCRGLQQRPHARRLAHLGRAVHRRRRRPYRMHQVLRRPWPARRAAAWPSGTEGGGAGRGIDAVPAGVGRDQLAAGDLPDGRDHGALPGLAVRFQPPHLRECCCGNWLCKSCKCLGGG